MRTPFIRALVVILSSATLMIAFNNCGNQGARNVEYFHSSSTGNPDPGGTVTPNTGGGVTPPPVIQGEMSSRLMTGDQLLRSYSALTGVSARDNVITTEYALRVATMPGTPDPTTVTSPLMISVVDLASQFCDRAIVAEQPMAVDARRLFVGVNFTVAPATSLPAATYTALVNNLAQKLWGRAPDAAEMTAITNAKNTFVTTFNANTSAANQTRATVLFTCTAMLSSYDALTL